MGKKYKVITLEEVNDLMTENRRHKQVRERELVDKQKEIENKISEIQEKNQEIQKVKSENDNLKQQLEQALRDVKDIEAITNEMVQ